MPNIKLRPNSTVVFMNDFVDNCLIKNTEKFIIQDPIKNNNSFSKKQKRSKGKSKHREERWH